MTAGHPSDTHAGPPIDALTVLPAKARAYGEETWLREAWGDLARATPDATAFAYRHALLVLKPEAIAARAGARVLESLAAQGFRCLAARTIEFDRLLLRTLWRYKLNVATQERLGVQDLLQSACPNVVLVLHDGDAAGAMPPASVRLTAFKGPAKLARRRPEHLRSGLGVQNRLLSYVHTTDEPADLVRELGIFFPPGERAELVGELLAGADRLDRAAATVRELEATVPEHDLRLETALARIARRAEERAAGAGGPAEREAWRRLARRCGSREREGSAAARALWAGIAERADSLERFDVVVAGAHLVQQDISGSSPAIGDADPAAWRAGAAPARAAAAATYHPGAVGYA